MLVERYMRQGGLVLEAGRVRSKKKKLEETHEIPPHSKQSTKSTAARRTRPHRDGMRRNTCHALAHTCPLPRSRVCGNRPRTALAISKNDECYTYTDRHRQTYILIKERHRVRTPVYENEFLAIGKKRPNYKWCSY